MRKSINLLELVEEWDSRSGFSEETYYDYYENAKKYKNIYEKIKVLYECKWCKDRSFPVGLTATIEKWLANFKLKHERKTAFELVSKIFFYSSKELRALCEITFNKILKSAERYLGRPVDISFLNNHFIFVPFTDSGAVWCRHLRHNLKLNTQIVKQSINDLKSSDFSEGKYIIFIEDFVGSGADAVGKYINLKLAEKKREISDIHFFYLTLVATKWGIKTVKDNTEFEIAVGEVLGPQYKCFSDESMIYPEASERAEAEQIFLKYGQQLCICDPEISGFPLGFNNCQLIVVLYDNTPDNTLPVIWYPDKNWFPLFERSRRQHSGVCSI